MNRTTFAMIMVIDVVQFAPRIGSCCGERCESGRGRIAADAHGFACVVQAGPYDFFCKNKKLFLFLFFAKRRSLRRAKSKKAGLLFVFQPAHNLIDTKRTLAFCIARAAIQKAAYPEQSDWRHIL